MSIITTIQFDALVQDIYQHLMLLPDDSGEERGMGEMGDTRDAASEIVQGWVDKQSIKVI